VACDGLAFASGLAAEDAVLRLLRPGQRVLLGNDAYGGTFRLIAKVWEPLGITWTAADLTDLDALAATWPDDTAMVWLETPTNPLLTCVDIEAVAALAHARGALVVVDNTFATPYLQQPAPLGADVVVHSATKYLGGHSDVIAGVTSGSRDFVARASGLLRLYGPALDPHAAWLLDRGLRTLELRVHRQNESARALARYLEAHPAVEAVLYPGLPSHPDHPVASELLSGPGGMVSMVLRGGGDAADRLCDALTVARVAPSLGGVETLVSQPRYTSHAGWSAQDRGAAGIPDGFVRVSVGVEDPADLTDDFGRGLDELGAAARPDPLD